MFDSSFFFNTLFIFPVARRILAYKKSEWSKTRRISLAMGFLIAVGITTLVYDMYEDWGQNYFEMLGVPRDCTTGDVKRAYKTRALELHPDKSTLPNAEEHFVRLQTAYNVLLNEQAREVYDHWGEDGLGWLEKHDIGHVTTMGIVQMCVFYVSCAVMVYILTLSSSAPSARSWAYGGLSLICVMDFGSRFGDLNVPVPFFPSVASFQKIFVLQKLFPSFMNGCIVVQSAVYVDMDKLNFGLLAVAMEQNKMLALRLQNLEAELRSSKVLKGAVTSTSAKAAVTDDAPAGAAVGNVKTGYKGTRNRRKKNGPAAEAEPAAQSAASVDEPKPPPKEFKVPGWVWFAGIYILFNYVLK